ncbi:hypothetical protein DMN77_23185 [Paenibacillus sp. 79R4]|uniref:helix-turn-helix transcriptional regulator n=1 Tax=Paenibacillus sp. 79R4 TaxID=2212847 RepID=UPI0015BE5F0F|nr:hypothetical protein [Paenibacillus sp. 79R4]
MDLPEPGRSRLPELLTLNKMTARQLSNRIGCTEAHISQVISGRSYLSYVLAWRTSRVLNCTMEELHES